MNALQTAYFDPADLGFENLARDPSRKSAKALGCNWRRRGRNWLRRSRQQDVDAGGWPGGKQEADVGRRDPPALVGAQPDIAFNLFRLIRLARSAAALETSPDF